MSGEFDGKVALVTGAAGGIGRATALAFARAGARLAITDLNAHGLRATAEAITACGAQVLQEAFDITHGAAIDAFVQRIVAHYGRLDCAVNNAGIRADILPLADFTEDAFDRVIATNLKAVWLCMKHEIHAMLKTGGGAIVNIASGAGIVGVPGVGSYVAAKHGVIGLTRTGALDYARQGIRINAVCPGFTRTPMVFSGVEEAAGITLEAAGEAMPIGRIAEPEEQANAVLFLCSEKASYMAGHALVVDGGHSIG